MRGPPWTLPLAALTAMWLPGCAGDLKPMTTAREPAAIRKALAPVCSMPTPREKLQRIMAEIEAVPAGSVDTLATEWERHDDWARKCRGSQ